MTLSQILFHQQTIFAIFIYCISVIIALFIFAFVQDKSNNIVTRHLWDKVGLPLIMTCLMIGFILLIYPINFGMNSAPPINEIIAIDGKRSNFLINMIFLLTFFFPLIPIIGKWEELIIPLQGVLASVIIFRWLCQELGIERYSLFPDFRTLSFIIIISLVAHWLAKYFAAHFGEYLDKLYHREGFQILIFKAVIMIMQSPVIFIFGIYLGKQISK
jgi:hypothetical protein